MNTLVKLVTVLLMVLCAGPLCQAQDPAFVPGGPGTGYLTCPVTVAPATTQVSIEPSWIVGVAYTLLEATSEIQIKSAGVPTDTTDALRIAKLTPVFNIGFAKGNAAVVQFPFPLYCPAGIVLEATGANAHVQYVKESVRRKLPF